MKRMGKILSLFLTAAMAASCLAGCNNSDENADTSSVGSKPSSSTDYDMKRHQGNDSCSFRSW